MEQGKASMTALPAAVRRAIHQLVDEPRVFVDPVAVRLVEAVQPGAIEAYLQTISRPEMKSSRSLFVLRSRFAEDELSRTVADGVQAYVALGAGLDTFAYRQPAFAHDLRIFEVDHPATQVWKREALAIAGIALPHNLAWAPVDFEHETVQQGLVAAGFDAERPAFFSWLGVTQYLTPSAIDATLGFIASLPHPSTVVFTFVLPDDALAGEQLAVAQQTAQTAARRGEPWLTRFWPDQLCAHLYELGFDHVFHLTPEEATRRYFAGRQDGMEVARLEQLISATV